jgi:hypothetical protein
MDEKEELLYKLAMRLTTFFSDPNVENPQLLVGSLPDPLPIHIPMPKGTRVIGTLVRGSRSLDIILEVPLTNTEVRNFYAQELKEEGWEPPEGMPDMGMRHGGFAPGFARMGMGSYEFYTHNSGVNLNVQIANEAQGQSDVRLTLNKNENTRATRMRRQRMQQRHDTFSMLPTLQPPEGAFQHGGGGSSGGNGEVHTSAVLILQDALSITDIIDHYAKQLVNANWAQTDAEVATHSAWSAWEFRDEFDEQWQAMFSLVKLPGEGIRYQLNLRAELKGTELDNVRSWGYITRRDR